ncbi:alpha/beta fold hydrolase [Streptomyces sp. NPDC006208]|uniref:thioesterase II family protein n=1 Tax=Streptomyces sp. NPDC006208 TaxID=3156734 RepID=UPI0033AA9F02
MSAIDAVTPNRGWISARFTVGLPRLRLLCLPHSGGSAAAFNAWRPYVPEGIELAPLELPGRGSRIAEPVPEALEPLLEAVLIGLRRELTMPYALFGHSFGAVVAYELTRMIERDGLRPPTALLVTGARAPHLPLARAPLSDGSDEELIAWLSHKGGLPAALLDFPDFLRDLLRAVRADMALAEGYRIPQPVTVGCPLFAFAGAQDGVSTVAQIEPWAAYTSGVHRMRVLPGGHTFPQTHPESTLSAVLEELGPFFRAGPRQ